jgi:hypothetical protein
MYPPGGDQGHEDRALGADLLRQPAADARRGSHVVDEDRRRLEGSRRDPRRLLLEIDRGPGPPLGLDSVLQSDETARAAAVVADQRDGGEIHPEPADHLLDQQQPGRVDIRGPQQSVGKGLVHLVEVPGNAVVPALGPTAAEE